MEHMIYILMSEVKRSRKEGGINTLSKEGEEVITALTTSTPLLI